MDEVGTAMYAPVDRGQLKETVRHCSSLVGGATCNHTHFSGHTWAVLLTAAPPLPPQVTSLAAVLLELVNLWK